MIAPTENGPGVSRSEAFGLRIASDLPLPELESRDNHPGTDDVVIRLLETRIPDLPPGQELAFRHSTGEHVLTWAAVGTFKISGTNLIEINRAPGVSDAFLRLPLLGPVLALLLHLRGALVLHASSVTVGSRAAVFLGDKMAGKSTTAAAFLRAGHKLVTDDVLAISRNAAGVLAIHPGYPQLKLDPAGSSQMTGNLSEMTSELIPNSSKRLHRLRSGFSLDPIEPARFYVLERNDRLHSLILRPEEGLSALMRYSYAARFSAQIMAGAAAVSHLRHCAELATHPGVSRLHVPGEIGRLGEVVNLVVEDCS
jgi:hypothetical protein